MEPIEPFLLRALAAGVGVAVVAGVIGCFVVWRRMAYFGDSLAHSALLGVALGIGGGVGVNLGILAVCTSFAVLLHWLMHRRLLAVDTLLGILAHSTLALGILAISALELRINLHSYLFGDILTINSGQLWVIYLGGATVLALLAWQWSPLLMLTISEDVARAEGMRPFTAQLALMLLMAAVASVGVRVVGVLLITSMLVIPAATARGLARSPEGMAALSALFGALAAIIGVFVSLRFDTYTAPTIVVASASGFVVVHTLLSLLGRRH